MKHMESKAGAVRFEALDSLRGFAAIAVVVYHCEMGRAGYLAVDFFLVLSGFILSHNYMYNNDGISLLDFVSRRLARLYPLHFFTLFLYIAAHTYIVKDLPRSTDGTLFTFIQHLTLTHNIGFSPSALTYNAPSWSISVEFWVNIIFIVFVSKTTKSSTLFFIALVGFLIIYGNTGHINTITSNYFTFVNSGILRGLSSFFLGILSYRIYLYYKYDKRIRKSANYIELLCITAVLVIVLGRNQNFSSIDMFAPFLFMFLIAIFAFELGTISNHTKKYKYLGAISYSIYLNQFPLLVMVKHALKEVVISRGLVVALYLVMLIVLSHFTYQYIEKPLRKKSQRLLSRVAAVPPEK